MIFRRKRVYEDHQYGAIERLNETLGRHVNISEIADYMDCTVIDLAGPILKLIKKGLADNGKYGRSYYKVVSPRFVEIPSKKNTSAGGKKAEYGLEIMQQ